MRARAGRHSEPSRNLGVRGRLRRHARLAAARRRRQRSGRRYASAAGDGNCCARAGAGVFSGTSGRTIREFVSEDCGEKRAPSTVFQGRIAVRVVMFYHSLVSDWNHGNAHFLRGVATELLDRGHDVEVFEPAGSWSRANLVKDHGEKPIAEFHARYPNLNSTTYTAATLDLDDALADADLVLVHEWNDHSLVNRIGRHRAEHDSYCLLFHDTHHRAVSRPEEMGAYDLSDYEGVLVFGETIRQRYLANGWSHQVWVWHEAADVAHFYPRPSEELRGDLVWIGNWGDNERAAELDEYLIRPVAELGLKAAVYGVRYPQDALDRLAAVGIEYRGWLPNWQVPRPFGEFRVTVHVPRRPYVQQLPGIPT